ncbi:DUF3422 family protein [Amphibiibacter pelophylacis]|uniref:DUF3422 domain-containing protein n=1 Tax=Amphibiibacter pelophylacis TaxID=1799477 RepID=A0ACC6P0Y6_9BURK
MSPMPFTVFPGRQRLNDELHARPPIRVDGPTRVSYLAFLTAPRGDDGARDTVQGAAPEGADSAPDGPHRRHLAGLFEAMALPLVPGPDARHLIIDTPAFRLKWEQHGEFCTYTFFQPVTGPAPVLDLARALSPDAAAPTALAGVPADWLAGIPGELLVATHLDVIPGTEAQVQRQLAELGDPREHWVASSLAGEAAWVFTDFRLHDGFSRITLVDGGLGRMRGGRTVQRLLEIETYRITALLAFPVAKEVSRLLGRCETHLAALIARMSQARTPEDERAILGDLTQLAAEVEHSVARTTYRFGASAAYYRLVQQRIRDLKERYLAGYPSIQGFMARRLAPALDTCAAVSRRQSDLSARIARTSALLRTRVDIELERQNQAVLLRMDQRAHLQLRLQETVEGLSVVVLTYYGSQLVNYLSKGLKPLIGWSSDTVTAISIPVIAALVAWGTHRMRRKLAAHEPRS